MQVAVVAAAVASRPAHPSANVMVMAVLVQLAQLAVAGALPFLPAVDDHVADYDAAHAAQVADYFALPTFASRRLDVPIVEQSFEMMHDGSHRWSFEGADGTGRWEEAIPAGPAWVGGVHAVHGGYKYAGEDGPVAMAYVADEHGFQPTGTAVHPDIVRAVAIQVAKAKSEPDGMYDEQGFPVFGFRSYGDY